jgi:hypothetical protein
VTNFGKNRRRFIAKFWPSKMTKSGRGRHKAVLLSKQNEELFIKRPGREGTKGKVKDKGSLLNLYVHFLNSHNQMSYTYFPVLVGFHSVQMEGRRRRRV